MSWVEKNRKINNWRGGDDYSGLESNIIWGTVMLCFRSNPPVVFLGKGVLKVCNRITGEHQCRSVILIKLQSNFIDITLRQGCSLNLLNVLRKSFPRNTCGELLLVLVITLLPPDMHVQFLAVSYFHKMLTLHHRCLT